MAEPSDAALVRACLARDADAFAALMRRHARRVYSIAYAHTMRHADAEDVTQETFIRAYRRLAQLRAPERFASWVSRIAYTCSQDALRARVDEEVAVALDVLRNAAAAVRKDCDGEMMDTVLDALASLTLPYRVAVTLRYMDGASYEEIAEIQMTSRTAAYKRVERGIAQIRSRCAQMGFSSHRVDDACTRCLVFPLTAGFYENLVELLRNAPHPSSRLGSETGYGAGISLGLHLAVALGLGWFGNAAVDTARHGDIASPVERVAEESAPGLVRPTLMPELPMPTGASGMIRLNINGVPVSMPLGLVGTRIAVTRQVVPDTGNIAALYEIVTMNVDGSDVRILTAQAGASNSDPIWSPDGRTIYFESQSDRVRADGELDRFDIWAMDPDGQNARNLTRGVGHNEKVSPSPDGARLAFQSTRTGLQKLHTMNVDGTDVRQLTFGDTVEWNSSWSPDGTQIAFISAPDIVTVRGPSNIHVINADGTGLRNLSKNPWNDHAPYWTPDGKHIVFHSYRDRTDEVYIMDSNGENQRRLTHDSYTDIYPRLAPDGSKIIYLSGRSGRWEVWMMNLDGSEQVRIANDVPKYGNASWSPMPRRDVLAAGR